MRIDSLVFITKVTLSILLRYVSISPIDKVLDEFDDMLEFVIELIYIERASAITVEFVELLNVLNDNAYIENMQKTKDLREGP
jgi:hypothetical protein